MSFALDGGEILRRAIRYVLLGFSIALSAYYIPRGGRMKLEDVIMISVSGGAALAVLDLLAPSIGASARTGAGFGIGAGLVGFPN